MTQSTDIRQSVSHDTLDQLTNTPELMVDAIFTGINSELTCPLRMSATTPSSLIVNVAGVSIVNPYTNRTRVVPPIGGIVPTFTGGTIMFPSSLVANVGLNTITFSTGGNVAIPITLSAMRANVLITLNSSGQLGAIVGDWVVGTPAVPNIGALTGIYIIGYIQISSNWGRLSNISQSAIVQQVSGGDNPAGTTDHNVLTLNAGASGSHAAFNTHIAASSGIHGLTGAVVGTSTTQVITNKDINLGTASATGQLILPQGTLANLTGLARKEGTLWYATDTNRPYYDNGTVLNELILPEIFGGLTGLNGEVTLLANQTLMLQDAEGGIVTAGYWATDPGTLSVGKGYLAGCGTANASICVGGATGGQTGTTDTELYNGNTWHLSTALGSIKFQATACGTQIAALCYGGVTGLNGPALTDTLLFNGLTWSTLSSSMVYPSTAATGCGKQYAAMMMNGRTNSTCTQIFNGASWSTRANTSATRVAGSGCGTTNSALYIGGFLSGDSASLVESYNGTTWSVAPSMSLGRWALTSHGMAYGCLVAGGIGPGFIVTGTSEYYNGYSWTNGSSSNSRAQHGGAGTINSALIFGGSPDYTNRVLMTTSRYFGSATISSSIRVTNSTDIRGNIDLLATTTFTNGTTGAVEISLLLQNDIDKKQMLDQGYSLGPAWSLGGGFWKNNVSLAIARDGAAGCGSQNAALVFGGWNSPSYLSSSELFNGSAWHYTGNLTVNTSQFAGCGTQYAALSTGGYNSGSGIIADVGRFDSNIWTSIGNLTIARSRHGCCGAQGAALIFGGAVAGNSITGGTDFFNGASWYAGADMNQQQEWCGGCGVQNAALRVGGDNGSNGSIELFNGLSWIMGSHTNINRQELVSCGAQNAALAFGESLGGTTTEEFNGVAWTFTSNVNSTRRRTAGAGNNSAALLGGGSGPLLTSEIFISLLPTLFTDIWSNRFFYRIQ